MKTYIALLRGINVGGKNRVSMPFLKAAFEEAGFHQVITYINSGNVVFKSDKTDISELIKICETAIDQTFDLSIPVGIISGNALADMLANAPSWWDSKSDVEMVHQAIFLIPPMTAEQVIQSVGEAKPEYEQVGHYENVIFWSARKASYAKTRWCKIASKSIYSKVTIRNANTSKKLLAICENMEN